MKKHKKKIILVLSITCICLIISCVSPFLPIYEKTDEDGISVIIDNVRYKQLPELKWYVNPTLGKMIGYAGSRDIQVSEGLGDTERNFIFLKYLFSDYYSYMLYRADRDIPDVSQDSVDKILWVEKIIGTNHDETYSNAIADKEIINSLLKQIIEGEKIQDVAPIKNDSAWYHMVIWCYCSDLPGASYEIQIMMAEGKLVCGNPDIKYVEISSELLEDIAGHEIDIEELLS